MTNEERKQKLDELKKKIPNYCGELLPGEYCPDCGYETFSTGHSYCEVSCPNIHLVLQKDLDFIKIILTRPYRRFGGVDWADLSFSLYHEVLKLKKEIEELKGSK